jgi:hypothetical protein
MAEGVWTVIVDVNVATFSDSFTVTHAQQTTTLPAPVITIFSQNSKWTALLSAWGVYSRSGPALISFIHPETKANITT